jgi:hypothetical protein
MKSWFHSKTVWINLLTMVGALVALPEVSSYVSPQVLLLVSGAANIVLRIWFTTTPVSAPGT